MGICPPPWSPAVLGGHLCCGSWDLGGAELCGLRGTAGVKGTEKQMELAEMSPRGNFGKVKWVGGVSMLRLENLRQNS